jgi:hypothetical protein
VRLTTQVIAHASNIRICQEPKKASGVGSVKLPKSGGRVDRLSLTGTSLKWFDPFRIISAY